MKLAVAVCSFILTLFQDLITAYHPVCGVTEFDVGVTTSNIVYCGNGYHECEDFDEACCSDVQIDPIPLTIIILGPLALFCSLVLVGCVIKIVISAAREDRQSGRKHSVKPGIVSGHQ